MRSARNAWRGLPLAAVLAFAFAIALAPAGARAFTFVLPPAPGNVVGSTYTVTAVHADTISDLAIAHDQGYLEMRQANPEVDAWLPGAGTEVRVPARYVLPRTATRKGVVVNVPEMRLYFYPEPAPGEPAVVITHPISIGRQDWTTPHGGTKVTAKVVDPSWYPPESIREEHAERGEPLPRVVPAGPDNPLGRHAMRLDLPGYLIHGTNRPAGLGMRVTHGCIRMYPEDIARIFPQIELGTPVHIVNQPFKIGIDGGQLLLEAHPHLEEDATEFADRYSHVVDLVIAAAGARRVSLDWEALRAAVSARSGVPVPVGTIESSERRDNTLAGGDRSEAASGDSG